MAIEGQAKSIRDLIMENNLSFHIPIYQRTYTWKARGEVEKLISDICEFGNEYKENNKANYYIGNVIVKEPESRVCYGAHSYRWTTTYHDSNSDALCHS